jgi:NADPH-dependent 2,4-dienoyl-CoA reductase/sulfur reductase-like enzyme
MKNSPKIIIIGGNAAGPAAAAKAKRTNPDADVTMFEASEFISTGTCELPYVLSNEIQSYENIVFYNSETFKHEKGVNVYTNHSVQSIDRRKKILSVRNKLNSTVAQQSYDKLILTTGSTSKTYTPLSNAFENVTNFKTIADLLKLKKLIKVSKEKKVCIIGSGYIGLELAEAFSLIGFKVLILEKELEPFPNADREVRLLIKELINKNDIEFIGGVSNPTFHIEGNFVKAIKIDGRRLPVDIVVTSVGFQPNNYLAVESKLELGNFGGIKTNNRLQTSDPNIFAAGDNIEIINFVTNRFDYLPIATIAYQTGHIAGENAAGGNAHFKPVVKNVAVKIFDKYFVQVGLSESEAKTHRLTFHQVYTTIPSLVKVMPESKNIFGKVLFEKDSKKILGASFLGGKEVSGYGCFISSFIKNRIQADRLGDVDFNYTPPLSPFISIFSSLGKKIKKNYE